MEQSSSEPRWIFYINISNTSRHKVEEYVKDMMKTFYTYPYKDNIYPIPVQEGYTRLEPFF